MGITIDDFPAGEPAGVNPIANAFRAHTDKASPAPGSAEGPSSVAEPEDRHITPRKSFAFSDQPLAGEKIQLNTSAGSNGPKAFDTIAPASRVPSPAGPALPDCRTRGLR